MSLVTNNKFGTFAKLLASITLVFCIFFNGLPNVKACGPSYLAPIFEYTNAPENPWSDFASGKLGIVKTTHQKIVLTAAFRYLKGGTFSQTEQKALIEIWEADFNLKEFEGNDVTEAVKGWLKQRASVVKNEEKLPAIYTEREYQGGYDYFPNCTKNAFEVAKETLSNRSSNEEKDVQEWIRGQDAVFGNCLEGAELPKTLDETSPKWLLKDREYQIAAAQFYAMKYQDARDNFDRISQDSDSPWKETADYLVARTLIRQASVGVSNVVTEEDVAKSQLKSNSLLSEAETRLNLVMARSSKFSESSAKMINLIKYRTRPEERIRELAQTLSYQGNPDSFRQDVIDYNWLLEKLENAVEKSPNEIVSTPKSDSVKLNIESALRSSGFDQVLVDDSTTPATLKGQVPKGKLPEAVMIAQAANGGKPVRNEITEYEVVRTDESNVTLDGIDVNDKSQTETNKLANRPTYLKDDEISDWIFTYQSPEPFAYTYASERWRETSADIWLMTALSKATTSSVDIKNLIKDSDKVSTSSVAYPTIAYHVARLLISQKKDAEARKLIDSVLYSTIDLPISTRNSFIEQRMKLSETLADFLKHSLRKPFAYGYDDGFSGSSQTMQELIQRQKDTWNATDFADTSKSQFDADIEKQFASELAWDNRLFLNPTTVQIINEHFSTPVLLEVLKNPDFPDYWKKRLIPVIWTRSYLIKDEKTALAFTPEIIKLYPQFEEIFLTYSNAKTISERDFNGLNILLKVRFLTPYLESGFDKENIDEFDTWVDERWWCEQYDGTYTENSDERIPTFKPAFLSKTQIDLAKIEHEKLKKTADAASYLTKRVFDWARLSPTDKRLPESLYLIYKINQWTKYGCGDYSQESRIKAINLLKKRFPKNAWTQKMIAEEIENPTN